MAKSQKKTRSEIPIILWPAQTSTFQKKNRLTTHKFVINFIALSFLISCGPALIWNVPADDLPGAIASGDITYLKELDLKNTDLSQILEYGPGSAYLHAYLAREIGREELFAPLLEAEWLEGERPWRLVAGEELVRDHLETGRYAEAEKTAAGLLNIEDNPRYKRLYIEALYRQTRDAEVLEELEKFDFHGSDSLDDYAIREIELFKAVSSARLARPGWKPLIIDLFLKQAPSSLHYRVLRFLENDYHDAFGDEETAFFGAVVSVADRRYADAAPVFLDLFTSRPERYLTETTVEAAYTALRFGALAAEGARLFEALVRKAGWPPDRYYALCEAAALLYFHTANYGKAKEYLEVALDAAFEEGQRDRMRWYLFRGALIQSVDRALEMAPSLVQSYGDPAYFSDIFDLFLTRLVDLGRWRDMFGFYLQTKDLLDPRVSTRGAYLCAAAFREGMLTPEDAAGILSVPVTAARAADLLFADASLDNGRYYSLLGAAALGIVPDMLTIAEESSESAGEPGVNDLIAAGFITYGLAGHAVEMVEDDPGSVSDKTLLDLARALSVAGDTYNSMRMMDILGARPSFRQTRNALELSYPRAYRTDIEAAAKRDGIPPYLLFALIREESYFKHDIVSRSGAVGLSQLMPATAGETARRMGIDLPPLTDPGGNISIGSSYFSQMLRRFAVPSNAVFAYNAGPTRMLAWRREYAGLPEDLLLEALPIEETQGHGRKVFSSAVMYGYLYYGVLPAQVAGYYFALSGGGSENNEPY